MNDWIKWEGGDCPVSPDTLVVCERRDGGELAEGPARGWDWRHRGLSGDIMAFRVSLPSTSGGMYIEATGDPDMVNHPPHYQLLPGIEVYDVRAAMLSKIPADTPHVQVSDWDRATEYLMRMWNKNGIEDAKKAQWYLTKLIERMEP